MAKFGAKILLGMIYRSRPSFSLISSLLTLYIILGTFTVQAYEPTRAIDLNDPAFVERIEAGESLFKANCTACHAYDRKLVGPAMSGVWERWSSEENLIAWIRNNQAFLETGDPYAVALYNEYNQSPMNLYLQFTDDDILNIIDYLRAYPEYTAMKEAAAGGGAAAGGETAAAPDGSSKIVLWILLGFLALMMLVLIRITSKLDGLAREKEGAEPAEEVPFLNRILNKRVLGTVAVVVLVLLGYSLVKGAVNLGRSQGYAPEQPIKFSHAIHAGQNQIDCQYCHSGVEKSKHAYIPSTTVCMNCHKYVQEGPKYGKEEIAKIYEAAGWDVDQQAYTKPAKPVEWVKIHQLPDHVYFNHAQHVKVGGLDCQTCHGNVQEMELVEQFAPLSMGWCVNCHRETNVKFNGNEYYETTFERFHKELEMQERAGVTVEDIGGAECQKCHY